MAKRSTKPTAGLTPAQLSAAAERRAEGKVQALFPDRGWDPLGDERRDQSYLRRVRPQSEGQAALMEAIQAHSLTMALGPAGTGKTYLAISAAVEELEGGKVDRIVLSRPAIEAGEKLGYLPGDMQEKLAPYLRPLYDALSDRMGGKRVIRPWPTGRSRSRPSPSCAAGP